MTTKQELEFAQKVANTLLKNSKILEESWKRYQKATNNLIKKMMEQENEPPKETHQVMIVINGKEKVIPLGVEKGFDTDFVDAIHELRDYAMQKGGKIYVEYK